MAELSQAEMIERGDDYFEIADAIHPFGDWRLRSTAKVLREAARHLLNGERAPYREMAGKVARQQDEFSRAAKQNKVGQPITSLDQFLDARHELDQMIARSKQDGQATPLTAELTGFRKKLNELARHNNKELEAADLKFSENRTAERLLADGGSLGKTLNQRSRQAIRDFRKMTPTQQEIFRVGFERQMADDALRVPRGNAAARQFNTESFDSIVAELYPKSGGKEVFQRGQRLLRNLRGEAISTETINDVMRGSRTAPVSNSIAEQKELAQAAADSITGRVWRVVDNLSNRLARQIGQKAAKERLNILTMTDPDQFFPMLVRLEKSAKTAAERQAYVMAIREYRRARLSPSQIAQTGMMAGQEETGKQPSGAMYKLLSPLMP